MKKLLIATRNKGKLKELKRFLSDLSCHSEFSSESKILRKEMLKQDRYSTVTCQVQHDKIKIVSLKDLNINEEVKEDGKTYKENSQKKALFYAKLSGLPTLADDSGVEINALNGEPGIKSKRWLGEKTTEDDLIKHMTKIAKNLPDENRKAVFKVVISLATLEGKVFSAEETVEGIITKRPHMKRVQGYPYRSFFYIPEIKKYYHENELTNDQQRMYNHRYKAIKKLMHIIKKELIY